MKLETLGRVEVFHHFQTNVGGSLEANGFVDEKPIRDTVKVIQEAW